MINDTPESQASLEHISQIQEDVDLLQYIYALYDAKWFLLLMAIAFGTLQTIRAKDIPNIYLGVARTDVRDIRDPGGVRPDSRFTPESIGMLEHSFALDAFKDNYTQVMLIRLRSHEFIRYFMDKHNMYKHLNPESWDENTQQWRPDFELDKGFDEIRFRTEMLGVAYDPVTDIVAVKIRHRSPVMAAELANLYVEEFNEYMRRQTLKKVNTKLAYLYQQLEQTQVLEIQKMLFRLIESQTAAAMLAEARKDYVLELLDPAVRPFDRLTPNRKQMIILGGIGGLLLGVIIVILLKIASNLKRALEAYAKSHNRKPIAKRYWGIRAWLYKILKLFIWLVQKLLNKNT